MSTDGIVDAQRTLADVEARGPGKETKRKQPKRARADKSRLHGTRHGMLSKSSLQSLADRGENIRQLRRIERLMRADLRPIGIVGELLFDRLFSSYLRCVLIARVEAEFLSPIDKNGTSVETLALHEGEVPALVYSGPSEPLSCFSSALAADLAVVRKYDSHFSREFYRALGLLLVAKNEGLGGLTRQIGKAFPQNRGSREPQE